MGVQWRTVLISILSSLLVSLTTFILGLRAGKNQIDRPKLKELYRNLSVHFREIEDKLRINMPKQWLNYEFKHTLTSGYYSPLVVRMRKDGTLLEIKPKLAKSLAKCEIDCLNYGGKHQRFLEKVRELAIDILKEYAINPLTGQEYDIKTKEFVNGKPYKTTSNYFGVFFDKEKINELCNKLNSDPELALRFEIIREGNKFYSLTIHEGALKDISLCDYVELVYNRVSVLNEIYDILNERNILLKRTDKFNRKIENRVREPHTFIETITMAFTDIFRV